MKKKRIRRSQALAGLLAVMALGLGAYGARRAWPRSAEKLTPLTARVEASDFAIKISANGDLQSAEQLTIACPPVPIDRLRIASVVPDGTHVNKGDVLVEFDPSELDLKVLENKSDIEMANERLSQGELASEVDRSDIVKDKKIAELELNKINEFLPRDERIFTRREIIEGELDRDYTSRKIVFADARLSLKGKVYSLDEAILLLNRKQADQRVDQTNRALASLKLLAPASGIVVYNDAGYFFGGFSLMPGRIVYIGMNLFSLVNPDKMEAKCYVLEKDAGELKVDERTTVTLDPFPGVEFSGKVKSIDKLARPIDRDSPVKYFQTVVSLDSVDRKLMKPGIKLKASIQADTMQSVIVVPRSAIVKKDAGYVVYTGNGSGQFAESPIALGRGDQVQVVVTDGLQSGQLIALNPPDVRQDSGKDKKKTGETKPQ